jgi:hypothetical protein
VTLNGPFELFFGTGLVRPAVRPETLRHDTYDERQRFSVPFERLLSNELLRAPDSGARVLESWKLMSMNQVFSSGFFLREVVG